MSEVTENQEILNTILEVLKESFNKDIQTRSILYQGFIQLGIVHELFNPIYNKSKNNSYSDFLKELPSIADNFIQISTQAEPQIEPQIEPQVEPQVEPQISTQVEPQVEPEIAIQDEPQAEQEISQISAAPSMDEIRSGEIRSDEIRSDEELKNIVSGLTSDLDYSNPNIDNQVLLIKAINNITNDTSYTDVEKEKLYNFIFTPFLEESIINESIPVLTKSQKNELIDNGIVHKVYTKIYNRYKKRASRGR